MGRSANFITYAQTRVEVFTKLQATRVKQCRIGAGQSGNNASDPHRSRKFIVSFDRRSFLRLGRHESEQ